MHVSIPPCVTQVEESEEPSVKEITRIGKAVDGIESKLVEIEEEVQGMEQVSFITLQRPMQV